METQLINLLLIGFAGGIIRSLVGILKYLKTNQGKKFRWGYLISTLIVSGIIGMAAGVLAGKEWQIAFLAGYAGTDFIEGLYKLKVGNILKQNNQ